MVKQKAWKKKLMPSQVVLASAEQIAVSCAAEQSIFYFLSPRQHHRSLPGRPETAAEPTRLSQQASARGTSSVPLQQMGTRFREPLKRSKQN